MKLARSSRPRGSPRRRGVALLMAFLVLMVVLAICAQLRVSTGATQRTTNNDLGLTRMDLAAESSFLEIFDQLKTDADAGAEAGGATDPAGMPGTGSVPGGGGLPGGTAGAPGAEQQPVDSREDPWGKPQRTEINQVELRVIVQDEDSKYNLLAMLTANEEEAEKAYVRVVRILDTCRQGTSEDIDTSDAERMATAMRDHLRKRAQSIAPRTKLLSDDEENPDLGLPLTLKEFGAIEPFEPQHFRDYRDERDRVVHSIGSFLTVHTALRTGDSLLAPSAGDLPGAAPAGGNPGSGGAPGSTGGTGRPGSKTEQANQETAGGASGGNPAGGNPAGGNPAGGNPAQGGAGNAAAAPSEGSTSGIAVNVNTAPPCVLKALMDDRDIGGRWWDAVIEYRNIEEKKEEDAKEEDADPVYDEYGREVIVRQVFDTLQELEQVPGTERLGAEPRTEVQRLLTTQSNVFSIFVTARIVTGNDRGRNEYQTGPPQPGEREDELGNALTRTVRAVVWRVTTEDGTTIVPIVRWEVLDYTPFEVLDYPEDDR